MCHGYTHGSVTYVKYPLLQYFEISIMIYHVIRSISPNIYRKLKLAIPDEDKSLLDILDRDMKTLKRQYGKRSTSNFDLYYKLHQSPSAL